MRTLLASFLLVAGPGIALADDPSSIETAPNITELTVSGRSIERHLVDRVLDEAQTATMDCYRTARSAKDKPGAVTETVKVRIDAKGKVASATATGLASINSCIGSELKARTFPVPMNGAVDFTIKLSVATGTAMQSGAFASLTGSGDLGSGFDDTNIYGGLLGNEAGEAGGTVGGGGTGWGTIGTGTLGTGKIGKVTLGDPTASGDAAKEAINSAIKGQVGKIRACYQKELDGNPSLAGKVTVKFHVEATGKVSSATGSGMPKVDACIAMVVAAIEFPKLAAASDVSYPFIFVNEGTGYGVGHGVGHSGVGGKSAAVPGVSIGQPNAQGDLDKAIIRRYIKRNIQKIQYCYEKQLLSSPKLAGTVVVSFEIGANGAVAKSTGSGVDKTVADCVADVIKNIEFPKPKTGGSVEVNYPFVFKTGE